MPQVEVLSPAGSMESFRAAINAGADAVYVGGSMFGARAFANNFNTDELKEAITIAHVHGRKLYLTVNTLLKNQELEDELSDFLKPAYENGLDAVIVQDFGVFEFVKKNFPKLDIHASTQMTITGSYGAKILENKGANRIVTSRELSLDDIKDIKKNTNIEIESFVHGALCYCYSGQCLLSSIIGGRSGNRGRCAQPCRLPYTAYDGSKDKILARDKHLLSPKDICTLEIIPDIIDSGVFSLKIEGRMKSPEYTAGVVSMYRKYVDRYLALGRVNYKVDEGDILKLMDLYNRGNFSTGYYNNSNGPKMMSMDRPNHQGTKALISIATVKNQLKVRALNDINPQDVIEIAEKYNWTSGSIYKRGEEFLINLPHNLKVQSDKTFFRIRNNDLLKTIDDNFVNKNVKEELFITGRFIKEMPMELSCTCQNVSVTVYGGIIEEAMKSPTDSKQIEKQLKKLGNTEFVPERIEIVCDEDIFVSVSELNELRRRMIDEITNKLARRRSV